MVDKLSNSADMHPIPYISLFLSINVHLKNPSYKEIGCSLSDGKIGKCLKYEQCASLKTHRELYTDENMIAQDCYNRRHKPMICCIETENIVKNNIQYTDETNKNDNENTSNDVVSTCVLPDDLSADCVNIEECESLKNNSNKYNETVLEKNSKPCKLNGQNKICCPPMEQPLLPTPNNDCMTSDGQQRECIRFEACDDFVELIRKINNMDIINNMIREHRCGNSDSAKICCALTTTSNNDSLEMTNEINTNKHEEMVCVPTAQPYKLSSGCCGQTNAEDRIMGGSETQINAYPWLGMIEYDNKKLHCGVVLISGMYALTAAHCVYLSRAEPKYIWLGKHNIKTEKRDCQLLDGGRKMCNNGALKVPIGHIFNRKIPYKEDRNLKDIALIKFSEMVNFTEFIQPICLPEIDESGTFNSNTTFKAAGWGLVNVEERVLSDVKRHVSLPYVPLNKCKEEYGDLNKYQICAGGEEGRDSCNGDSGGPLMYKSPNLSLVYQVIGITSFSHSCGRRDVPGVYTRVFPFLPWIYDRTNA